MQDIEKALADINNIRNQVAAGRMFKGFGPAVIALTGVFAILLMSAQLFWPDALAENDVMLLGWWIFAAFLSVVFIWIEMLALSRRHHGGLADSMITNAVQIFMPIGAAGAAITLVLLKNQVELAWVLPGIWQLLIALGIFSSLHYLPKYVTLAGAWYFIAGTIVLQLGSLGHPLSPWHMGIPFALGQWLMAYILYKTLDASHDRFR